MPLIKGKSQKSFVKNLKTEMHAGKPMKQSLAIAYAMKKKAKKMADGGETKGPVLDPTKVDSFVKGFKGMSKGGEMKSGYLSMPEEQEMDNESADMEDDKDLGQQPVDMHKSTEDADDDLVMRIMKKRYSKGGQVSNECNEYADEQPNEFDDLVLDDGLESTYGDDDNAGDALGNEQEDADRKDIVARIMASRRKKDKLPSPA